MALEISCITLIMRVDRIQDMIRIAINVQNVPDCGQSSEQVDGSSENTQHTP